jgi:hypothetical protein
MAAPTPREPPCVLDVEASGFGRNSYPVEVGFVMPDGRAVCTLIRPLPEWTHWDEAAHRLHGITREMALLHGRSPLAVAELLNSELAGLTVYSDGWGHDYAWLATLFEAAHVQPRFRLEHLRVLLDETQIPAFDAARAQAREELHVERHRASNDARTLQLAVVRVRGNAAH